MPHHIAVHYVQYYRIASGIRVPVGRNDGRDTTTAHDRLLRRCFANAHGMAEGERDGERHLVYVRTNVE